MSTRTLAWGASAAALALAVSSAAFAQETTGAIRGQIVDETGSGVAGATVSIVHEPSGTRSVIVTDDQGLYSARGLRVGGPYTVTAAAPGASPQTIDVAAIGIGDAATVDVMVIRAGATSVDEIVVTVQAASRTAIGPSAVFTAEDLARAPAINRDLRDVIAIDPRVYVDEAFVDAVQCGGANPRFNSLTVDGVRMNDNFGLNSSGYPTERMPFSYDAIEQVAVELAPFDVEYGRFTACNINAVTKSGGNALSGGLFYDFSSDALTGDSLEGGPVDLGEFEETRWGVHVGGPIIQDRLFFFVAYEALEGVNIFDRGPAGSNAGTPVLGLSQAQYDEILDIAQNVYGFDPGGVPTPQPNEDQKLLVKLDWNISDRHRAAFTYNYNDGFNISEADGSSNEFEFSGHLYERGAELNAYIGQLFSDWTDNFSTELRIAYSTLDNRQISQGGLDVGEIQIVTLNDHDANPLTPDARATVYLGADDSRHANVLSYETRSFKLGASYTLGDHLFTAGFEREEIDIFNMFVQHNQGEFRFDDIDDFRNGLAARVYYGNAATLDPADAAAEFAYGINTLYAQDELRLTDDVTITAGFRYDFYDSDDAPNANPNFLARNGFSNTETLDGKGLLQPRFGFSWDVSDTFRLRGGAGLYSGGNPNVWLSNNYSNDGVTNIQVSEDNIDLFAAGGQPLFDIPQVLIDEVTAAAPNVGVNALDPAFRIPSEWKFALGASWWFDAPVLGEGVRLDVDLLHSETQNAAVIRDLALVQIDEMADGRPVYRRVDRSDPDCLTNPGDASICSGRGFNNDFLLTNGNGGSQTVASFILSQSYDWGLDWTLGYAWTQSEEISPMTSSVAFSNYANAAVFDPNNPDVATSNYEIPHRITLAVNYEQNFFGDYATRFTLFGRANEGRPYSYTFTGDDGSVFGDSVNRRHLLYVPTGPSDPNVVFAPGFDQASFFQFLEESGLNEYAGGAAPRNAFRSDWWTKFDLRVEQELPGFAPGHRTSAFLVVENLGNLLNDEWGILREAAFPQAQDVVNVGRNAAGQYVFENFFLPSGQSRVADASLWEIRVGVRYQF